MDLNPYLAFNGQCEEAFTFYARVLGAKIEMMLNHADSPMAAQTPPEWQKKIMHARLKRDGQTLMGSDAPPGRYEKPSGFFVSVGVKTPEEADRIFGELSKDGAVHMPIQETFWAKRFGMLVDKYGTPWMVNCEKEPD